MAREHVGQHEQEIGQAIQVFECLGRNVLDARQRSTAALGAPADGAGDWMMTSRLAQTGTSSM